MSPLLSVPVDEGLLLKVLTRLRTEMQFDERARRAVHALSRGPTRFVGVSYRGSFIMRERRFAAVGPVVLTAGGTD